MDNLFNYPATRRTDPISSFIAEEKVTMSGKRRTQALLVLTALRTMNGATSRELATKLGGDRYIASRRLPDLEKAGLVTRGGFRECTICNQKCVIWFVNDRNE